jgi:hypothetical protein
MSDVKARLRKLERAVNADDDKVEIVFETDEERQTLEVRCERRGVEFYVLTIGGIAYDDI